MHLSEVTVEYSLKMIPFNVLVFQIVTLTASLEILCRIFAACSSEKPGL